MIDLPRFVCDNRFADGAVTATSTKAGFHAQHIADWHDYTYWRSSIIADQILTVDCGVAKSADMFILSDHNLANIGGSVSLECSDDNFVADVVVAVAAFAVVTTGIQMRSFSAITKRYWRIKIAGVSGSCYIGIAVAGMAVVFPMPLYGDYTPQIIAPSVDVNVSQAGHVLGAMRGLTMARAQWRFDILPDDWYRSNFIPAWDRHFVTGLPGFFIPTITAHPEDIFLFRIAESGLNAQFVHGGSRRLSLDLRGIYKENLVIIGNSSGGIVCPVPDPGAIPFVDGGTGVGLTGAIVLGVGESNTKIDAGYYFEAAISGYVWIDTNGDGYKNEPGAGINGIIIQLWDGTKTTLVDVVVTANDVGGNPGSFEFTRVIPAEYYVKCIKPTGYNLSPRYTPAYSGTDSDVDGSFEPDGITPNTTTEGWSSNKYIYGNDILVLDIGLVPINGGAGFVAAQPHTPKLPLPAPPALIQSGTPSVGSFVGTSSIGDRVWSESAVNGVQDDGEIGKLGVYVYLHVADMSSGIAMPGEFIASQITDASGNYSFSSLAAGTYVLKFAATDGSVLTAAKVTTYYDPFSGTTQAANDFIDSDAYRTYPLVEGC